MLLGIASGLCVVTMEIYVEASKGKKDGIKVN